MTLTATGVTDIGTRRISNQDAIAWHVSPDGSRVLGIVADGMGGYKGGEIASQVAVNAIVQRLAPLISQGLIGDEAQVAAVHDAIRDANEQIQALREEDPALGNMGTTVVATWVQGDDALIAHIGDSRCYLISNDTLSRRTRDDTVVQNMIDDGSIRESDAPNIPFRNVLTQALGSSEQPAPSLSRLKLAAGERLLLCSDGLPEAIPEAEWTGLLARRSTARDQVRTLIDTSLDNGAKDNVSVVMILKES
ncbi:PP2C family protein-serine/threonine phosphatase [Marinobacter bohaiensis]|uniref:PP2C family protein-serine/threonine phosphatase n=1 Tax=Marinobacter bohaiensis TaxID=2201898 RepID=UPI000DACB5C5|nr:protein phosphatase 2C domain-containing protein [Marinobacter bohaiensis]